MKVLRLDGPPDLWLEQCLAETTARARNWGLICGFGYGFSAATFAFMILLFATVPGG
jgi:hypothetical protein